MNKILIGKNIIKSFAETGNVLDNVSVAIADGEFVAIMGPSGSGKSTLLFALSGMDSVDAGEILFMSKNLSETEEKELADIRRTQMGFVFQQPTMLANLNILDNIILPAMRGNHKNLGKITEKAKKRMQQTGIEELKDRDITQVSGGQLQRAGICRALINAPKILFADEPTGALNSKSAEEIMNAFSKVNAEGTTILLVTHDAKVATRANRVLFMKDGKITSELHFDQMHCCGIKERTEYILSKMREIDI